MAQQFLFSLAKRIFSIDLLFSGFDPFAVYKYKTKPTKQHPKLARYEIQEQLIGQTAADKILKITNKILYAYYAFYLFNQILIPIHILISCNQSGRVNENYCNRTKSTTLLNKLHCLLIIYESKTISSAELVLLYSTMFLQGILARFFCTGSHRLADMIELRSLFDRDRELDRLKCSMNKRLSWFKRSIEIHRDELIAQSSHISQDDQFRRHFERCQLNLARVNHFMRNSKSIIPKEFNDEAWNKLRGVFTRTVLALSAFYLFFLALGHLACLVSYRRVKCQLTPACQDEIEITRQDRINFTFFAILGYHAVLSHSAFPMILGILQFCHSELIDGWNRLIRESDTQIDQLICFHDASKDGKIRDSLEKAANRVSFDSLIKVSIYQMEIERINYALSSCLEVPIISALLTPSFSLILYANKSLSIGKELVTVFCLVSWVFANTYAIQCSMAAAKVDKVETNTWSLVARNATRALKIRTSHNHIYQDLTSLLWRRIATNYKHSKFFYSPHPFGLNIDFHFVMEANFYIMSAILIVENLFMPSNKQ